MEDLICSFENCFFQFSRYSAFRPGGRKGRNRRWGLGNRESDILVTYYY